MIAEAWAKRRYEAAFVSKLNDALGEDGDAVVARSRAGFRLHHARAIRRGRCLLATDRWHAQQDD